MGQWPSVPVGSTCMFCATQLCATQLCSRSPSSLLLALLPARTDSYDETEHDSHYISKRTGSSSAGAEAPAGGAGGAGGTSGSGDGERWQAGSWSLVCAGSGWLAACSRPKRQPRPANQQPSSISDMPALLPACLLPARCHRPSGRHAGAHRKAEAVWPCCQRGKGRRVASNLPRRLAFKAAERWPCTARTTAHHWPTWLLLIELSPLATPLSLSALQLPRTMARRS